MGRTYLDPMGETSRKKPLTAYQLEVSARLRRHFEAWNATRKLSQEQVGEMLGGINQAAVSHYLRGRIALGLEALLDWAKLLGVAPSEIDPQAAKRLSAVAPVKDTPGLDAVHFTKREREAMARRVAERIEHHKRSYAWAAEVIGCSRSDAVYICHDGTESLPVIAKLCAALGDSLDYVVLGRMPVAEEPAPETALAKSLERARRAALAKRR